MGLFYLAYGSFATHAMEDEALASMLSKARVRNESSGITGVLLYGNERFFQYLEGPRSSVQTLFERIRQDSRHELISIFDQGDAEARYFTGWSMAFRPASSLTSDPLMGFLDYFNPNYDMSNWQRHPDWVMRLIPYMRDMMMS